MIILWIAYLLAPLFWLFDEDVALFWEDCSEYLSEEN